MGYGVMPDGSFNQACVFEHIQIVNADYQMVDIDPSKVHDFYRDEKQCYKLRYFGDLGPDAGQAFVIGGLVDMHACHDSI